MQNSHPSFSTCPWCGTRNAWGTFECRRCGGPQPAVETADAGPNPPPPPREIPRGYGRRAFFTETVGLVGGIFFVVGTPFLVIFPLIGVSTGDMVFLAIGGSLGAFFTGLGFVMFVIGLRRVQKKIETYRSGQATNGTVEDIYPDRSITVNGRNPWKVVYTYRVMGTVRRGSTSTWHLLVEEGSPLHVLYLPNEPGQSAVYPPLGSRKP